MSTHTCILDNSNQSYWDFCICSYITCFSVKMCTVKLSFLPSSVSLCTNKHHQLKEDILSIILSTHTCILDNSNQSYWDFCICSYITCFSVKMCTVKLSFLPSSISLCTNKHHQLKENILSFILSTHTCILDNSNQSYWDFCICSYITCFSVKMCTVKLSFLPSSISLCTNKHHQLKENILSFILSTHTCILDNSNQSYWDFCICSYITCFSVKMCTVKLSFLPSSVSLCTNKHHQLKEDILSIILSTHTCILDNSNQSYWDFCICSYITCFSVKMCTVKLSFLPSSVSLCTNKHHQLKEEHSKHHFEYSYLYIG